MALEALRQAHRRGEAMLARLERALPQLEREGSSLEPIDEFLAFCDGELEAHFAEEEESLFPRLERVIGPAGPMTAMLKEHLSLWKAEDALKEGLEAAREANSQLSLEKARSLVPVSRHMLWLLRSHIEKEEKVLFPLAERFLSPQDLREVEEAGGHKPGRGPLPPHPATGDNREG